MEKISCLNCKHSAYKCKACESPSGWFFYCKFYEQMFDMIGACNNYQEDSRNNE